MKINSVISKAIKSGKWIDISYNNVNNDKTSFWIAIEDIDPISKKIRCEIFNEGKGHDTLKATLSYDRIAEARIIEFSSYDVPEKLINKIETNIEDYQWLNYDNFNNNVLNYYIECNMYDNDPYQDKDYDMIQGIDLNKLKETKKLILTDEQISKIVKNIYHFDLKKIDNSFFTLAINFLSIDISNKKYIVCYYPLTFNPKTKSLLVSKDLCFNYSFMVKEKRHSLFNYINMDMDEFAKTFVQNYDEYISLIRSNMNYNELIDTRPDIILLKREIQIDLAETFEVIEQKYEDGNLPIPIKSFFGNITKRDNNRRKEPSLIIYDKKINVDQIRVLYNALKYPVTFVQGPPGTGKTQTIINVVLCGFYNEKTTLVCSANNKPVDGIIEKLSFDYRGEKVNFPFLRLGNFDEIKEATLKIKELYDFSTDKEPKDSMLNKIKSTADDKNARLIELLKIQDKRVEIENCLETSYKFINAFDDKGNKTINAINEKVKELNEAKEKLPKITNEELTSIVVPIKSDRALSQFLYFKSLQYIMKLKKPRYKKLIEICNIKDDDERAIAFNKWTQDDKNMKLLVEVFPVIFSTNISSKRLGSPNFMFDLVVMDEAGQCNVATALLPVAKAESLLLVGDPNQLRPVIVLEDNINEKLKEKYNVSQLYDYKKNSILDIMTTNDTISKYILLKYHYRCGKKIINFSNIRYYKNSLKLDNIVNTGTLELINVKNNNTRLKNEAFDEAIAIANYIERNKISDAYIVTPFVNQKKLIEKELERKGIENIKCGTIHSLQGAEKETIIFSTAISFKTSKKTYAWLKDNHELINVAVTRAKNKLVIATDTECVDVLSDKKDDLYNLIQYVKNNGDIETTAKENPKIEIGKSNGSISEDEFYKTISQFCTSYTAFEVKRNVDASKVINVSDMPFVSKFEFDVVLYKKQLLRKPTPVIAFEINGGEHLGKLSREKADRKKMEICGKNNIKLIFIPNTFVKDYEHVIRIIKASSNKNTTIQETLFEEIEGDVTKQEKK